MKYYLNCSWCNSQLKLDLIVKLTKKQLTPLGNNCTMNYS